jgi:hypothetical protein
MRLGINGFSGETNDYCVNLNTDAPCLDRRHQQRVWHARGNGKSLPFLEGRLLYTVPALDNREQPVRWVTA